MRLSWQAALLVAGTFGAGGTAARADETAVPGDFSVTSVNYEQNATDGDTEVVFTVKGDDGLERLTVIDPDGRTVIEFACPLRPTLGMRQFRFESPEPSDSNSIKAAFPEGTYSFRGATVSGQKLVGEARLTHTLPPVATFMYPKQDDEVPADELEIRWNGALGLMGYVLEIEQEETQAHLVVHLPATANSFTVPKHFLAPGLEYQLGIGTMTQAGNASFVETTFVTAERDSRD